MAQTPPPNINPAPAPAPQRGDRTTFSSRVDAFVTWLITAVSQFYNLGLNVYNNAVDAYNSAVNAASQATAAQALVNVPKWVSGTTYANGAAVWSPANGQTYRRITAAGSGTTDPSVDSVNWSAVVGTIAPNKTFNANFNVVKADKGALISVTPTYPATINAYFDSAASMGNGWYCFIQNIGNGTVLLDPNGILETIQGVVNFLVHPGCSVMVTSDGANLRLLDFGFYGKDRFGTDITAAATLDLLAVNGRTVIAQGAATITTVLLPVGLQKTVVFGSDVVLVHSANLLTSGQNLYLGSGSIVTFVGTGSGVRVLSYVARGSGILHLQDQKPSGTSAATATGGTEPARNLSVPVVSTIPGASVSTSQVTLPAGTYDIDARAPATAVDRHRLSWYNVTDSARTLVGGAAFAPNGSNVVTDATLKGRFTITATKVFELRHYVSAGSNLGLPASQSGVMEVYAEAVIERIT